LWITRNQDELRDSRLQSYSFSYAEDWLEESVENYKAVKDILEKLSGKTITGHKVFENGARITIYEDGTKILTNYSDKEVTEEGLTAAPYSFAVGRN